MSEPANIKVLVIGGVVMDIVFQVDEWPEQGEAVQADGERAFREVAGGKGLNQAIVAARLGCTVNIISALGNETSNDHSYNKTIKDTLHNAGVLSDGIYTYDGVSTDVTAVIIERGEPGFIGCRRASTRLKSEDIKRYETRFKQADIILISFDISVDAIIESVRLACIYRKPIVMNASPATKLDMEITKGIDYLVISSLEARRWLELTQPKLNILDKKDHAIGNEILTFGAKSLIFTDSTQGCTRFEPGKPGAEPTRKRYQSVSLQANNSTRSTDAFCAALAIAHIRQKRDEQSTKSIILYASAVGSLASESEDAIKELTPDKVATKLRELESELEIKTDVDLEFD